MKEEDINSENSKFKKYFNKGEAKHTSKEFVKDYALGQRSFFKKYWPFSLVILVLVFLFYKEIIPFHKGILLIMAGVLAILLIYFEVGFIFDSPSTKMYVLALGKKGYKILMYFLSLILVALGLVFSL